MLKLKVNKWVIMDRDRTVIAKGVPRNRYLIPVDDVKDKKRILYYGSKGRAISGYTSSGFYNNFDRNNPPSHIKYELEPVRVQITVTEIPEDIEGFK